MCAILNVLTDNICLNTYHNFRLGYVKAALAELYLSASSPHPFIIHYHHYFQYGRFRQKKLVTHSELTENEVGAKVA